VTIFDRYPTLRTVIVNTKTDRALRGVLWRRTRSYLVLRNVEMLKTRGETVVIVGEVMIESANVDFVQVI
jgi:small nuclear ribonucleoprotein (snRNP)-like protein